MLIGAILVILGREVFGKTHSRNTIWSVGIYVLGLVVIAIFSAGFILAIVSASLTASNPTVLARTLTDNFNNFLIGLIIGSAIIGIAEVRFTYALQTPTGRILLWAAYATSLAVGIALLAIIGPQVSEVVAQAISSGTFNRAPIDRLQSQLQGIQLLGLIPAAIYAFAYYLAWSRVKTGEIPKTNSRHTCRATGALAVSLSNPTLHKTVPADESRLEQLRIGKHGLKRARFTTLSPRF